MITLEKKDASIEETLVNASMGILAPMEKKGIELTVNCPEGLAISHDSPLDFRSSVQSAGQCGEVHACWRQHPCVHSRIGKCTGKLM